MMKQTVFMRKEDAEKNWWIIDLADQRLGRVATTIATLLRGKHKPTFTPNIDSGDFVIAINAAKVQVTGDKLNSKKYYRHSRFFGSLKEKSRAQKMAEEPGFVVREAVRGMLPDSRLNYSILNKLKVYPGAEHPHSNQKPQPWK